MCPKTPTGKGQRKIGESSIERNTMYLNEAVRVSESQQGRIIKSFVYTLLAQPVIVQAVDQPQGPAGQIGMLNLIYLAVVSISVGWLAYKLAE